MLVSELEKKAEKITKKNNAENSKLKGMSLTQENLAIIVLNVKAEFNCTR
ncbi:MAG: hypothetical protein ACJA0E_001130 [Bermanella sp.]|jgi:hypothetical protein